MSRSGKSFMKSWVAALVIVLAAVGVGAAFSFPGLGTYEKVKAVNGAVAIPLAAVSDGTAHFYKYSQGGKDVAFFVVKSPSGAVKTAFDACDVCFREKKGYEQGGGYMICKQCNRKFDINRIGHGAGGGCNPSFLPSRQAGGSIVIAVSDLMAGARFF